MSTMTDIAKRLRWEIVRITAASLAHIDRQSRPKLLEDAAKEIERLRGVLSHVRDADRRQAEEDYEREGPVK